MAEDSPIVRLGLDLGTQSVRALAVDDRGAVLASASRPLTGRREGGRHEQDPEQWWRAVTEVCRETTAAAGPVRAGSLAVDATSGTILLADSSGRPLTPGLMYDDARAVPQAERATREGAEVWERLGYRRMQPSWALPKLLWLLEHEPAAVRPGTRLLHQADLITWRLAGRRLASDTGHTLKTGYDLVNERWPAGEFARLGVPEGLLPEVVRPGEVIGTVGAEAAAETGIPEGTVIVAGTTDGCAAQIGAGALDPGAWNSVLGTTLVLKGVSPQPVRDPEGVVYSHLGPGGRWLPGGASSSGAGVLTRDFPGADPARLTEAAARAGGGAVAYPLVSPGGERFPFRAPDAEPFVLGDPAGEAERFHARLLGVACLERLCFDRLDLLGAPVDGPLTLTGGGARNPYWNRLRADVLGRAVRVPENAESALGMAVLAATCDGRPVQEAAASMVRLREEIRPDPERTAQLLPVHRAFTEALAERGWIGRELADHAHERASR